MTEKVQPYEIQPGVFKLEPREIQMLDGDKVDYCLGGKHNSNCSAPITLHLSKQRAQHAKFPSE